MKKQLFLLFVASFFLQGLIAQDYVLEFDGIASRVRYDDDATLQMMNGATDYTIEVWIKPNSSDIHNNVIIKRYYQFALTMYQDANKRVYFTHYTNGGANFYVNSLYNVLNMDEWNHIAVICNSTDDTLKLYVNGVDVTANGSGEATSYTAHSLEANPDDANATYHPNFYVGYSGADSFPTAYIDKVRVKNVAEDIASLQTSVTDANYSTDANTTVLFYFDEGTGDTTLNQASGTNAALQCSGGCSEIPQWELLANTMSTVAYNITDFSVYPNPASELFTVKANENIKNIEIYNILGQTVKTLNFDTQINQTNVNVESLSNGQYLVKINTNLGTGMRKLVIK